MKRRFAFLPVGLVLISLLLNACALQHHALPEFQITNPHNGDTLPLNQAIPIRVHVADLTQFIPYDWVSYEYTIMDGSQVIAHVGAESIRQRDVYVLLQSPTPGQHDVTVQGRAARPDPDFAEVQNNPYRVNSAWFSDDVCFWVGPDAPPDFCSTRTIAQPIQAAPTATSIPVLDNVQAFPSPIYYGETCPSISTVTFRAALTLPHGTTADQLVVNAHVGVRVGTGTTDSGSLLVPLQPTQTWDAASGGQIFLGQLALTHAYNDANNHFNPASLNGGNGALLWFVDIFKGATSLGRSQNQVIDLAPCPTQNQPRNNSSGGPAPGGSSSGGSASGCGAYTNQISCNLAGCSWDPSHSACTVSP